MESNVIQMGTAEKVQLSIFNLFAPITAVCVTVYTLKLPGIAGILICLFGVALGIYCMMNCLKKYSTFVGYKEGKLFVCTKQSINVRTDMVLNISELTEDGKNQLKKDFMVKKGKEQYLLLDHSPSLLGTILVMGPFVWIPLLKKALTVQKYANKLSSMMEERKINRIGCLITISDICMWLFSLFIMLIGVIFLLFVPFYPFLHQ